MNKKAAVSMMTKVMIGLVIAVPFLLVMFKVSQGVYGILFPSPSYPGSVDYVFNNFIEYYMDCKESESVDCSCGAFDYGILLDEYSIRLEQNGDNTIITLFSKKEGKVIREESLIENNILCAYVPLRKEGERIEVLDDFKIEKSYMDHGGGTIFSHEGNIFLVKTDELHTCFPTVSPALENYNEFMKMESCFIQKEYK